MKGKERFMNNLRQSENEGVGKSCRKIWEFLQRFICQRLPSRLSQTSAVSVVS
jgi:hypothetical protein